MLLSYGNIQNKVLLSPPFSLDKDLFLLDEQEYPSQRAPLSPKLHKSITFGLVIYKEGPFELFSPLLYLEGPHFSPLRPPSLNVKGKEEDNPPQCSPFIAKASLEYYIWPCHLHGRDLLSYFTLFLPGGASL